LALGAAEEGVFFAVGASEFVHTVIAVRVAGLASAPEDVLTFLAFELADAVRPSLVGLASAFGAFREAVARNTVGGAFVALSVVTREHTFGAGDIAGSVEQLFLAVAVVTVSGGGSVAPITSLMARSAFILALVESLLLTCVYTGLDSVVGIGHFKLDAGLMFAFGEAPSLVGNKVGFALAGVLFAAWLAFPLGSLHGGEI